MPFKQIACADVVNLSDAIRSALQQLSEGEITWWDAASDSAETVASRIGTADAALTSFGTPVSAEVFETCPNLCYLGVCGTSTASIDLVAAAAHGVTVRNVFDYCDESTAEFVIGQLIRLARGWGEAQWRAEPTELTGKRLGIIGMGAVAQQLAKRALAMDMHVSYFSRTRKPEVEALGVAYTDLPELLKNSDIVSLHVPKNTSVLNAELFTDLGPGKILVNTCLGQTMPIEAVVDWLKQGERYVIMDRSVDPAYHEALEGIPGAVLLDYLGGITADAKERLGAKVVEQMRAFLDKS